MSKAKAPSLTQSQVVTTSTIQHKRSIKITHLLWYKSFFFYIKMVQSNSILIFTTTEIAYNRQVTVSTLNLLQLIIITIIVIITTTTIIIIMIYY